MRYVYRLTLIAVAFLILKMPLAFAGDAAGGSMPAILTIGHSLAPDTLYAQSVHEFQRRMKARLGTGIETVERGNAEIGNEGELLRKVRDGERVFALVSPVMTEVDDQFGVFDMPYLILTREHLRQRRARLLRDFLEPAALAKGIRLLGLWENGFRHITNNVRPIESPKDLSGLILRVPTGRWQSTVFQAFGTHAVPLEFDKVRAAIQDKQVDGQENALSLISAQKFDEIQTYLSLTSHTYMPIYFIVNERYFQSLPPTVREAVAETAKAIEDWAMNRGEELDAKFRAGLSKRMAVNEADKLAFILASFSTYAQFVKAVPRGKELINLMFDKSSLQVQR